MPTSVAATVMRASSPAARPAILMGTVERRPGLHFLRRLQTDVEHARRLVDGEPAQAESAGGHALGLLVHGPIEHDGDVGAGVPVVADADRHLAAAGRQIDLVRAGQARAHHRDERASRHARGDLDARGLASLVGWLVEGNVEHLRAVGRLVGIIAGAEHRAGDDEAGAVGGADLEAIAAPVDLGFDFGRRAGGGIGCAGGDAARAGLGLEVPRAVAAVPLPAVLEPHQLPLEALGLDGLAVGPEENRLEASELAFLGLAALEQGPDADSGRLEIDGQRDGALDRAPAGFPQLQDHVGFQRPAGLRQRGQQHGDVGLAFRVGGGQPFERLAYGCHLLVGEAELVAGKARQIALGELHGDLALDGKAGGGGPVEIAAGELDGAGLLRGRAPAQPARA